jgi:hypothetical protein
MHGPINVKSANNTSKWQMGINSAFKVLIKISSKAVLIRIHAGHAKQQIDNKSAVAILKKILINIRPLEIVSFFARCAHLPWAEDAELYNTSAACRFS